ncbi:uncharacterized protein LOC125034076 [Penaeus chinensis]|uniref:uncharacterized protein LOC125034076 n=1 Tax=Penaeus chinensis TaxID=139456 RepID=UPI001FB76B1C|nr:uncharacterized protein LOC125034076 [Penaeus chinensis]
MIPATAPLSCLPRAFLGFQHLRPPLTGRDSGTSREGSPRPVLSGNTSELLALAESDVHSARQFVVAQLRRLRARAPAQKGNVAAAIEDAKHHFGYWALRVAVLG